MVGVAKNGRAVHRWVQSEIAACEDRDELGLEEIDLAHLDDADDLRSADVSELRRHGAVLLAERDRDELEAFLAAQLRMPADGDDPVVVGRRLSQLHYPIWRLRWHVRGRLYQAAVDGMTGTLLHARVPARQRRRAFLGMFAAACGGYVLGTMLRRPSLGLPDLARSIVRTEPFTLLPTFSLVLLGIVLYALLVNAALNSLRYRNELEYHAGLKTRILINRPAETLLDRGTAAIKATWNRFVAPRRYDR